MPSLSDLVKPSSRGDLQRKLSELLRLAGLPTLSWHKFSILRHFFENEPILLEDAWTTIGDIARGGYPRLAKEGWLDLLGEDFFAEARKPAVSTVGLVTLTDAGGAGPHTITVGAAWVANTDKSRRFVVESLPSGGTLPQNGTLQVSVRAESAGADWNVGVNAIDQLLTALPGVTVSNPAQSSGTWITTQGADKERDEAYGQRLVDKWSTLGAGCNDAAYRYYASSASPEIVRVQVGSPGNGGVRVLVAGASGPVSEAARAAADAVVQAKRPTGVPDVQTIAASVRSEVIRGTLFVKSGRDALAAKGAAQAAAESLQRSLEIGALLSRELIIDALVVDDLYDLTLETPAADIQLLSDEIFVPVFQLTTQAA